MKKTAPPAGSVRRAPTVSDIAAGAGVSRATVSLVLRESPLVHADTRARVQAELKKQNYIYNRGAANLRRRTSSAVALVINDLSNPFFAEFAAGVDAALGDKGYVTLLGNTGESPARQQAVLASLMEHTPAGLILSPAEHSGTAQLREVLGTHLPVLVFNRNLEGSSWDFLALDNARGAAMATAHLIERGHRHIAFYGGHADSSSCRQRRAGFEKTLRAAGLRVHEEWMIETAPSRIDSAANTAALFQGETHPTAAVCYNDAVALGLMLGLAARGMQPGRDFALTGFDDIPEAALASPPLTTVATQPRERGRQAAELLLMQFGHLRAKPRQTTAPAQLQIRESTPPPTRA
jgi:LacI family transcriptional regulator